MLPIHQIIQRINTHHVVTGGNKYVLGFHFLCVGVATLEGMI